MRKLALFLSVLGLLWMARSAGAEVTSPNFTAYFTCSGGTGPYPFTFPISDAANSQMPLSLTVTQNGTILTTGQYTVTPVNNNYTNGGTVNLTAACPSGQLLVLQRTTPVTQLSIFTDNMPVPMKTFENSLDKLTEILQETNANVASKAIPGLCPAGEFVNQTTTTGVVCGTGGSGGGAGNPAGPAFALNFANSTVTNFQGDSGITANPITHTIAANNLSYHTPSDYGAKANGKYVFDAVMNSGSCVVTSASGGFSGAAPGMIMFVVGAGNSSWDGPAPAFSQTIASVQSNNQVTMTADASSHCAYQNAPTPVNGNWNAVFGTDDSTALQSCITNGPLKGGRCTIPQGQTITYASSLQFTGSTIAQTPGGKLDGAGTLVFIPIAPLAFPTTQIGMWINASQRFAACEQITGGPEVYSLTIATAGSGQTPGTYTVNASGGGGSGATASIIVSAAGTVTQTPAITNPGSGYTSAPTFTLSAGGTAATFTATMGYVPTASNPITTFTVASSSEYAGMLPGDWVVIGMEPIAGVVEQTDWAQFLSGSGTTVTLMHPTRMAFSNPVAYTSSCQGLWFFGIAQNSVPTNITMADFTMIVPNVQDSSGNHATAIDAQFTRGLIRDNITVMNAGERAFAANFDQRDIAVNDHFNESYRSEYTNSVDDVLSNDSWDNTPSSITGGQAYGTNPGSNEISAGPSVSYGSGFCTLSGLKIHNPHGSASIAGYSGVHDCSFSDISIDFNTSTNNPTAGMIVTGGYNNRFSRMSLNGTAATSGSTGLLLQSDLQNGVCFPTTNNLWDKIDAPNYNTAVGLGQCNGSLTTSIGTDIDSTNGAYRFSSSIETQGTASFGNTATPVLSPLLLYGSPSGGMQQCMTGTLTANDCWGTVYSAGSLFTSYNAGQPTFGTDQWTQYLGTVGSSLLTHDWLNGLNFYTAPSSSANAALASFWSKIFEVNPNGNIGVKNIVMFPAGVQAGGASVTFNNSAVSGSVQVAVPNANSNTVQGASSATAGDCVQYIDLSGVQHYAACSSTPGTTTICSGTITINPGAISSGTASSAITATCTGLATTDNIQLDFSADPTGTTGYAPSTSGTVTLIKYPTANTINVKVENNTASSITPGSVTLNYRVVR